MSRTRILGVLATLLSLTSASSSGSSDHYPCWVPCHTTIEVIAKPIYYFGMLIYYLCYPLIYFAEIWRWFTTGVDVAAASSAGFLWQLTMFIPNLILSCIGWFFSLGFQLAGFVVSGVWQLLSLLPNLIANVAGMFASSLSSFLANVVRSVGEVASILVQTAGLVLLAFILLSLLGRCCRSSKAMFAKGQRYLIYVGIVLSGGLFALEKSDALVGIAGAAMEDELMFAVAILVGVIYVSLLVKHFSKVVVVVIVALAACAGLYLLAVTGTLVVWVGGKIATGMYYAVCGAAALTIGYIVLTHVGQSAALVFSVLVAMAAYAIIQLGITHVLPVVVLVVTCPFSCISGCVAGLLDDMVYFEAVFGLRWMVL